MTDCLADALRISGTQPGKGKVAGWRGGVHQAETDTGTAPEASDGMIPFVGLQAIQKGYSTDFKVG